MDEVESWPEFLPGGVLGRSVHQTVTTTKPFDAERGQEVLGRQLPKGCARCGADTWKQVPHLLGIGQVDDARVTGYAAWPPDRLTSQSQVLFGQL